MAEGAVHERTTRLVMARFRVGSERAAQEGRTQIYRDAGEPYHERAKNYALRAEHMTGVIYHVRARHIFNA